MVSHAAAHRYTPPACELMWIMHQHTHRTHTCNVTKSHTIHFSFLPLPTLTPIHTDTGYPCGTLLRVTSDNHPHHPSVAPHPAVATSTISASTQAMVAGTNDHKISQLSDSQLPDSSRKKVTCLHQEKVALSKWAIQSRVECNGDVNPAPSAGHPSDSTPVSLSPSLTLSSPILPPAPLHLRTIFSTFSLSWLPERYPSGDHHWECWQPWKWTRSSCTGGQLWEYHWLEITYCRRNGPWPNSCCSFPHWWSVSLLRGGEGTFPLNVHVHILHTYVHNLKFVLHTICSKLYIRESVDSLCRDGADMQYMQYLSKSRITSPQTR